MADLTGEIRYRGEFLVDRYQEREDQPWETLRAAAEDTSRLVRRLAKALVQSRERIGDDELTALFRCCQTSRRVTTDRKKEIIQELGLPEEDTTEILQYVTEDVGSVGGRQIELHVYDKDADDPEMESRLHASFETLISREATAEDRSEAVRRLIDLKYHNVQSGRMSPVLHYLNPTEFPIINGRSSQGMAQYFNQEISSELVDYLDERETYKTIRDQLGFEPHYRDLDWFFNWTSNSDNTWTEVIRNDTDREVWQAQPGTTAHSFPEVLWPTWQSKGIISVGFDTALDENLESQERTIVERMSPGDIVLAKGGFHTLLGMGVVTTEGHERLSDGKSITFSNDGETEEHRHIRYVEWVFTRDADDPIQLDSYGMSTRFDRRTLVEYTAFEELRFELTDVDKSLVNRLEQLEQKSIAHTSGAPNGRDPAVWIEKTKIEGRDYKQQGELKLGRAILSPSRDEGGRKRYETLREADVGDIVIHLLQDQDSITGISVIDSELQEDFGGPPADHWSQEQREEGGYLRRLQDFAEIEPPIDIYDDILNNDKHEQTLQRIRENSGKIFYNRRLSLNQGHYFTRCPDELVEVFATESSHLVDLLNERGYDTSGLKPEPIGPAGEYDTISEATEDVRQRLSNSATDASHFREQVAKSVVSDWTTLLSKIAVQSDSAVTQEEAVLLDQIKTVYTDSKAWFSETADDLGVGTLYDLSPPEVLYTVLLRELQTDISAVSQPNANHVKLKTILRDEYTVEDSDVDGEGPEHPLLTALGQDADDRAVHHFTGPPDYWTTALRNRALSFPEDQADRWRRVSPGDIGLFHSRADPGVLELEPQPNGFIGAVIFGERFEKSEPWWIDEFQNGETFPYLISFDRLFVTGDFDELSQATSIDDQNRPERLKDIRAITTNLLDYTKINEKVKSEADRELPAQDAFSTFDGDDNRPEIILNALAPRLSEVSAVNPYRGVNPSLDVDLLDGLYFQGTEDHRIIQEIEAALRSGKHIILTGPPGTGKTEIAEQVAGALTRAHPAHYAGARVTTATADWSTFDTVGGYMPQEADGDEDGEELSFTPGTVLNRLRKRTPDVPTNEALVIDELNRADIDKAFGQLFTVLSGQSVTLPYTRDGEEIEILPASGGETEPASHQYVIPESWRMFATMNTYDKTSLYEMSYAFMRRFAFIRVGAPSLESLDAEELRERVRRYVEVWDNEDLSLELSDEALSAVGAVWQQTNATVENRAIGPAIVRDIVLYLHNTSGSGVGSPLTRAVISYIFPQLEGVPKRKQIVENIASVTEVDETELRSVAREMLQVSFEEL